MNVVTVVIAHQTHLWIRVAIRSLREACAVQNVLCIDNNHDSGLASVADERNWLSRERGVFVVKNKAHDKQHGAGIDLAMKICRDLQADYMLLIEPDCYFTGREWFDGLLAAVGGGLMMAGVERKPYGPIHPCLSIWRVSEPWPTFRLTPFGDDANHPRFNELFNVPVLEQSPGGRSRGPTFDTAQKAWFYAAVNDSARLVKPASGFLHCWMGSRAHSHLPAIAKEIGRLAEWDCVTDNTSRL